MERKSAPIQLAQCRFHGLAISNAKILIYFSNKIHGSNFIKQRSETVMVWNWQDADRSFRDKILLFDYYNFRHTVVRFSLRAAFTDVIRKRSLEAAFTTTTRVGWALVRVAISSVTLTTLKRAATSFAAWWTEARWVAVWWWQKTVFEQIRNAWRQWYFHPFPYPKHHSHSRSQSRVNGISFPIPGEFHGTNGTHGKPHELLTSRPE